MKLLLYFSWRHARRHPARAFLGAASIALGVALFVSADIANSTVVRAFDQTIGRLAGKARYQVTFASGAGVDTAALDKIEALPGTIAAPVLQRSTSLSELEDGPVLVFGVDFMKDRQLRMYDVKGADPATFFMTAFVPQGVVVTRRFAGRHSLALKSKLVIDTPTGKATLFVTGILENEGPASVFGGNFLVMGLAHAQKLFSKPGIVDHIDVAPPEGMDPAEIRKALGPGYAVSSVNRRSAVLEDSLSRVKALIIVSIVALIVGVFIIYNSVSISVVERVREMAILRSIGTFRRQILRLVLIEWSIVGLAGSAAGVALGYGLATILVQVAAKSANTLTMSIDVREIAFAPSTAAIAIGVGTLVSILAALVPGLEAMRVPPMGLMSRALYSTRLAPRYLKSFFVGAGLILAGSVPVIGFYLSLPPYSGMAATVLVFVGVALVLPQVTLWFARWTRPAMRRLLNIEGYLAADNVSKFPQRTALTAIALGGALSMMVASSAFLLSLKTSADRWMDEAFPFDLSVNGTDLAKQLYSPARFPEALSAEVAAVDGVESVYSVGLHYQPFRDNDVMLLGIEMEGLYRMHLRKGISDRMKVLADPEVRRQMASGEGLIVSENFMNRYGARPGTDIELQTADGPRTFRVLHAVEDYSWPSGTIVMDRAAYARLWKDDLLAYIDIKVKPGVPVEDVKGRVGAVLRGTYSAFLYTADDIRKVAAEALDQAFALSNVQVLIAMIIGFLGILNTLLISVLRRTREIGLLRAVGATRAQVRRTVVIEALIIGGAGGLIGAVAGVAGAALPLRLHTLQITGYWISLTVPWKEVGFALLAAVVIAGAASWLPARRAARLNVLEAIAYE